MSTAKVTNILLGFLLFTLGVIWLIALVAGWEFNGEYVWPVFLLLPGLVLWYVYLRQGRSSWGVLIPANILILLSVTFWVNLIAAGMFDIEQVWSFTVFMYPGTVALSMWIAFIAAERGAKPGMAIIALVLTLISLFLFCLSMSTNVLGGFGLREIGKFFWPCSIMGVGVFIIFSGVGMSLSKSRKSQTEAQPIPEAEIVTDTPDQV